MGAKERRFIRQCWREDKKRYPKYAAFFERSIWAVAVLRFGQYGDAINFWPVRLAFRVMYQPLMLLAEITTNISIPKSVVVGPGLRIYHSGGIVIHEKARIGWNCTLRHGITIGLRTENGGIPEIGDNVDIGAGAMILGGVTIGNNAKVGAGALVQIDIPEGGVAYAPRAALVVNQLTSPEEPIVSLVGDPQVFAAPRSPNTVPLQWSRPGVEKNTHAVSEPPE